MTDMRNVTLENGTVIQEQYFNWNSKEKGYVLSSFYYGYICTQVIGGVIAAKIGGNVLFGAGIGVTAVLTLLTPLAANFSLFALIAVRVIMGLFEVSIELWKFLKIILIPCRVSHIPHFMVNLKNFKKSFKLSSPFLRNVVKMGATNGTISYGCSCIHRQLCWFSDLNACVWIVSS